MKPYVRCCVVAGAMLVPSLTEAGVTLYDGANPLSPDAQGWLTYAAVPPNLFYTTGAGKTVLDTTSNNAVQAGFHDYDLALTALKNPGFPTLDPSAGFSIAIDVRVTSESHATPNRAGFSLIVIGSDLNGIEIGFWTDRIWAQSGPSFTHAEEALIDTTASVRHYELTVLGSSYSITAGGSPLLSGPLRNYSSFGPPYDRPNFLFIGDDTSSAAASSEFTLVAVSNTPPTIAPGGPVTRQQGSPGATVSIATVSDDETPAGSLTVSTTAVPAGISVSGITNTAGSVVATVSASCSAGLGANTVSLEVTDEGGLSAAANLTVDVIANSAPSLGAYPATETFITEGASVTPNAPPVDTGMVTALTPTAPSFAGNLSANPGTGVVTVANASPIGSFTVTVTATDNCGATAQTSFGLSVCSSDVVVVPDGRAAAALIGAGASRDFTAFLRSGASYAAEFANTVGAPQLPEMSAAFQPGDDCTTGTLAVRETMSIDPASNNARRASFTAAADGFHRFRVANTSGTALELSFALSETTLFSPAWTTNGGFNTYYSFQNTTNATINATLTLTKTDGTIADSSVVSIPSGAIASTNTVSLATPRNITGTARLSHNGPPGALIVEAAIANFSLSPAYVQPVKFLTVRESR